MFFQNSLICALAVCALSSGQAFAAGGTGESVFPSQKRANTAAESKPSLGVFAGITDTAEGRKNGTSWGAEYQYQPIIPFSAGLQLSGYVSDYTTNMATLTRTKLLLTGNYNFGGDVAVIKDSWVGLEVGPVMDNVNHSETIDLGAGPRIGFDIPLGASEENRYTLGANADYLLIGGAKPSVFALNGVVKYWF